MTASTPRPRPDAAKLRYAVRMLYVSAGLFLIAGVIWLVSGNGTGIGLLFVAVAIAMAAAGRAVSTRT